MQELEKTMRLVLSLILLLWCSLAHANTRDGLIGWWTLDEPTGAVFYDSSWKGPYGTGTDTTSISNCPRGNCLSFNGTTSIITTASFVSAGDFSFFMWVYLKGDGTTDYNSILLVNASPFRQFFINNGTHNLSFYATATGIIDSGVAIPLNRWSHVGFTLSGTTYNFYVNGSSVYSGTGTIGDATGPLNIGSFSPSGFSNANFDDVRIYNRALTNQEIKDLYNPGTIIKGTGIKFNY